MNMPIPRPQHSTSFRSAPLSSPRGAGVPSSSSSLGSALPGSSAQPNDMPELFAESEPTRLHPQWVDLLRNRLHTERPRFSAPLLERFVHKVFADSLMVECYFHPQFVQSATARSGGHRAALPVQLIPLQEALHAAQAAQRMSVLKPHERAFAFAAALVHPCGLFHCAHPYVQKRDGFQQVDLDRARGVAVHLLEDAVSDLRRQHHGMGQTMAAVLGLCSEDGDAEQIARIATAVQLSQLRLADLWVAPEGWISVRSSRY